MNFAAGMVQAKSARAKGSAPIGSREVSFERSSTGGERQGKQKSRTVVELAFGANGAGVRQHDVLGDRQTEAGTAGLARACLVYAVEAFKKPRQVFGGDARTEVANI